MMRRDGIGIQLGQLQTLCHFHCLTTASDKGNPFRENGEFQSQV